MHAPVVVVSGRLMYTEFEFPLPFPDMVLHVDVWDSDKDQTTGKVFSSLSKVISDPNLDIFEHLFPLILNIHFSICPGNLLFEVQSLAGAGAFK